MSRYNGFYLDEYHLEDIREMLKRTLGEFESIAEHLGCKPYGDDDNYTDNKSDIAKVNEGLLAVAEAIKSLNIQTEYLKEIRDSAKSINEKLGVLEELYGITAIYNKLCGGEEK